MLGTISATCHGIGALRKLRSKQQLFAWKLQQYTPRLTFDIKQQTLSAQFALKGNHEIIKTAASVCRVTGPCSVLGPCAGAPARGFKRSRLWMLGMFVERMGRGGVETGTATFAWSTGCGLRKGDGLWYFGLQLKKVLVSRLWLASPMQFVSKSCFGVSIRSMLLVTNSSGSVSLLPREA